MTPVMPTREVRNATLDDTLAILTHQDQRKLDVVVPADTLILSAGAMALGGVNHGLYEITPAADMQLAKLAEIPLAYLRKMRAEHVGLLDFTVNEWLTRLPDRRVLVRGLTGVRPDIPEFSGIVRALLSDRYGIRDNTDTVAAARAGLRAAGLADDKIKGCDLTDNRMWLRVWAPDIYIKAPELLAGHRDVHTGRTSRETDHVIFAGICIENSETGWGKTKVTPELIVLASGTAIPLPQDAFGQVHLGARMGEGAIQWSDDTYRAAGEQTQQQVHDAVERFMTRDYLQAAVDALTAKAGTEIENPQKMIYEIVGRKFSYTETEKTGILKHFIGGGQITTGGIMHAITSYATDVADVTRANELQSTALAAMGVAHAAARSR